MYWCDATRNTLDKIDITAYTVHTVHHICMFTFDAMAAAFALKLMYDTLGCAAQVGVPLDLRVE